MHDSVENEKFQKITNMFIRKVKKQNDNPASGKLDDIVNTIFDLAYAEPRQMRAMARLCNTLGEFNLFKKILLQKCQAELNRILNGDAIENKENRIHIDDVKRLRAQMQNCADPHTQLSLMIALDTAERNVLNSSIRIVGFIGELCTVGMLTTKLLMAFMAGLTDAPSNEYLRLMCILLTHVGERLEAKEEPTAKNGFDMATLFGRLQTMLDNANTELFRENLLITPHVR